MNKKLIILFVVVLLFIIANNDQKMDKLCFKETCIEIELAISPDEKVKGLMFREELKGGMLFVYEDEARRNFWMKNTLIPLDIIWIDKDKKIVFIKKNMQPCEDTCVGFSPEEKAMYVLELNSGEASRLGLKVGDQLTF